MGQVAAPHVNLPSLMEFLTLELVEIFHSSSTATQSSHYTAAEQWARRIHFAFYNAKSTRGSNKFFALESTLTRVFARLSNGESAQFFWELVVQVLLVLAQEPLTRDQQPTAIHTASIVTSCQPAATHTDKKSSKKCQPNAPLAFLVVNALRKITSEDLSNGQMEFCGLEGRNNEQLRTFCTEALGKNSDIVRTTNGPSETRSNAHFCLDDVTMLNTILQDQKLLVELLGLFQITDIDPGLVRHALDHLLASKSHAALIKLCETFAGVDWPFESIVKRMVQTKDWASTELLVRTFEEDDGSGRKVFSKCFHGRSLIGGWCCGLILTHAALAKILIDETINLRDFKRVSKGVTVAFALGSLPRA